MPALLVVDALIFQVLCWPSVAALLVELSPLPASTGRGASSPPGFYSLTCSPYCPCLCTIARVLLERRDGVDLPQVHEHDLIPFCRPVHEIDTCLIRCGAFPPFLEASRFPACRVPPHPPSVLSGRRRDPAAACAALHHNAKKKKKKALPNIPRLRSGLAPRAPQHTPSASSVPACAAPVPTVWVGRVCGWSGAEEAWQAGGRGCPPTHRHADYSAGGCVPHTVGRAANAVGRGAPGASPLSAALAGR